MSEPLIYNVIGELPMNDSDVAVTAPVITPALDRWNAGLDALHQAGDSTEAAVALTDTVAAARALLDVLALRTYPAEPGTDDRGEQVVITVYGVDLSIRRRDDGLFVHIDSDEMPDDLRPLIAEVDNGGENVYGPDPGETEAAVAKSVMAEIDGGPTTKQLDDYWAERFGYFKSTGMSNDYACSSATLSVQTDFGRRVIEELEWTVPGTAADANGQTL